MQNLENLLKQQKNLQYLDLNLSNNNFADNKKAMKYVEGSLKELTNL